MALAGHEHGHATARAGVVDLPRHVVGGCDRSHGGLDVGTVGERGLDPLQEQSVEPVGVLVGVDDVAAEGGDGLADRGDDAGPVRASQQQDRAHGADPTEWR